MKTCSRCGKNYPKTKEFFYEVRGYMRPDCKVCVRERERKNKDQRNICRRSRNLANPEKAKEKNRAAYLSRMEKTKEYLRANKEKIAARSKKYNIEHADEIKANRENKKAEQKKYREKNKEKLVLSRKEYYEKNKDKRKEYLKANKERILMLAHKRVRERKKTDECFKISCRLRVRIYSAIKRSWSKKAVSSMELIGCSYEEFKKYFLKKFTLGMTWEKFLNGEIHIDHIIPCSVFDLRDVAQQKICFRYDNLQPLWASDNFKKSDSLAKPFQKMLCLQPVIISN